ncbi:MAG: DUF2461 domain-containing protein [Acidobacteriota bacterium]
MSEPSFSPALFDFIRDLSANNDRDWFNANKKRYERDLKDPALRFISDVGPGLRAISPHIQAIPKAVGGSLFRIYRDVRFSKDKRPYKTHVGIHFRHSSGKDAHAPGFYLHLEPGRVFIGAGIWHPENKVLKQIRTAIAEEPAPWLEAKAALDPTFHLAGDSLKTSPRGFDADHPQIEDLRRKDFMAMTELAEGAAFEADFRDAFLGHCRGVAPLAAYLCRVLDAPF